MLLWNSWTCAKDLGYLWRWCLHWWGSSTYPHCFKFCSKQMMIQSQMCGLGRIGRDGWLIGTGISLRRKSLPAFPVAVLLTSLKGVHSPLWVWNDAYYAIGKQIQPHWKLTCSGVSQMENFLRKYSYFPAWKIHLNQRLLSLCVTLEELWS